MADRSKAAVAELLAFQFTGFRRLQTFRRKTEGTDGSETHRPPD